MSRLKAKPCRVHQACPLDIIRDTSGQESASGQQHILAHHRSNHAVSEPIAAVASASRHVATPVQIATSSATSVPKPSLEEDAMETVQAVFNRLGKRERKELRKQRRALLAELKPSAGELPLARK